MNETSAGALLELVRTGRASTRADLARLTGLSRTAVTARVAALSEAGLLVEGGELASTGGRPPGGLAFNVDAGVVVGMAVGRSRSQVGLFDLDGRELAHDSADHEVGTGPEVLMASVADRARLLLLDVVAPVLGVGVSLPGAVDPQRRVSLDAPVMQGWDGVPLSPYLSEALGDVPVHLTNDTSALARSEGFARPDASRDALVVKASTGIALGIVADGRLLHAGRGLTGELGHSRVDAAGDRLCRCGATGCLETIAAGWALVARLADEGGQARHVRDLVDLALRGDAHARALLRESGRHVGETLAIAVNLLNPEVVVIGGDMGQAFDLYSAGVREAVYARATARATRRLDFAPARHGDAAGLVGCAALVIENELSVAAVDARLKG